MTRTWPPMLALALLLAAPACSREAPEGPATPASENVLADIMEELEGRTNPPTDAPPADTSPDDAPPADASPDDEPADTAPAEVVVPMPADARALLDRMLTAYQAPTVFTDEAVVTYRIQADFPEEKYTVRYGPGTDAEINTYEQSFYAIGADFYMVNYGVASKFLSTPLVDDIATMMGRNPLQLVVQSELRYGKPLDKIIRAMALGLRGEVTLDSYDRVEDAEGRPRERLTLRSPAGRTELLVDPETSFIVTADTFFRQPDMPQLEINRHLDFSPKAWDESPGPVTFDPEGRRPVATLKALYEPDRPQLGIAIGEAIPDFSLHTLEGAKVDSADMRGAIVVLHCWSSVVPSSTAPLDAIRGFAERWQAEGKPVQVWSVNMLETGLDKGDRWQAAYDYWEFRRLGMPSLFDAENEVARQFGVSVLPVTAVVDAEGRLVETFGALTETAERLAVMVDGMFETPAAPPEPEN